LIWEITFPPIWYKELLVLPFDMRNCFSSYLIWEIAFLPIWYEKLLVLLFDMKNCLSSYLIWEIAFPPIWYEKLLVLLFDSTIHGLVFCNNVWQNNCRLCGLQWSLLQISSILLPRIWARVLAIAIFLTRPWSHA
jgi:hypothetical protein